MISFIVFFVYNTIYSTNIEFHVLVMGPKTL